MATILLFHSVRGLRDVERAAAERLRSAGHDVVTPDLFDGATAATLDEGFAIEERLWPEPLLGRAAAAADACRPMPCSPACRWAAIVASQVWARRPATAGVLLLHGLGRDPGRAAAGRAGAGPPRRARRLRARGRRRRLAGRRRRGRGSRPRSSAIPAPGISSPTRRSPTTTPPPPRCSGAARPTSSMRCDDRARQRKGCDMTPQDAAAYAREICGLAPVIPVLVVDDAAHARPLAEALVAGGLPVLEVTLRTPAALDVIRAMAAVPGGVVGAGTLLKPADVRAAKAAGARFGVSPGVTDELARRLRGRGAAAARRRRHRHRGDADARARLRRGEVLPRRGERRRRRR